MNQDDPEKRIVGLERQPAEQKGGADLPPPQADAAPEPGADSGKLARMSSVAGGMWTGMLILWIGIGGLGYAGYDAYGYLVGTPTTATVDHCESRGGGGQDAVTSTYCTGTWSMGGQTQKGPIRPAYVDSETNSVRPGSSFSVRVNDGTAYRAASLDWHFYAAIVLGPILLVWGSVSLWRDWRGRNRG